MLTRNKYNRQSGFTAVELIITVIVSTLMIGAMVTTIVAFSQQFSVSSTRQSLNTEAELAVSRINDDIRNSISVSYYNVNPDTNAPTSLDPEYQNIPGNPQATDSTYNWRLGFHRLILLQPVTNASNNPVYSNTDTMSGPMNVIIYYVKNGTLYRRVVTGQGNLTSTINCASVPEGGCTTGTQTDQPIIRSLNSSVYDPQGLNGFLVVYYDINRSYISPYDGNGVLNYAGAQNTRAVAVLLALGKNQSGTPLIEYKGAVTQVRSTSAQQAATQTTFPSSITAGPGGISINHSSILKARTVSTSGPITLDFSSQIGSKDSPSFVTSSNMYCGTGASYGTQSCSSTQPVSLNHYSVLSGDLCATGQTSDPAAYPNGGYGAYVQPGSPGTLYSLGFRNPCTGPAVKLPLDFDKTTFTSSMSPTTKQGSVGSCDYSATSTLTALTTYDTNDVSLSHSCSSTIQGNIYIKKNFIMDYGAKLTVSESATTRPVIVVNGTVSIAHNATIVPNSKNIAPYIISFDSSNTTCSNSNSSCGASFSNIDLQSSVSRSSIVLDYGATAPYTLFQAYYGGMDLGHYSSIRAGAIAAQRVNMDFGPQVILDQ